MVVYLGSLCFGVGITVATVNSAVNDTKERLKRIEELGTPLAQQHSIAITAVEDAVGELKNISNKTSLLLERIDERTKNISEQLVRMERRTP